ncbi:zinc ribbon domain-containing protein [Fournierella massiliensis]|nr:zinc ribbon domain-containing protein [Fournierella massiliensis]
MDFDKILRAGSKAAESAKKTAAELADKGKKQVNLVNEQSKLARAQRQLGALVYSLHVNGEENQPLVEKYIQAVAEIEANIERLKTEADADVSDPEFTDVTGEEAHGRYCPQCGAEVEEDALFCNHCGAQL